MKRVIASMMLLMGIVTMGRAQSETYQVEKNEVDPSRQVHAAYSENNKTSVTVTYGNNYNGGGNTHGNSEDRQINNWPAFKDAGFTWNTNSQVTPDVSAITQGEAVNIIPRLGSFIQFDPTKSGTLKLYVNHMARRTIWVIGDGNVVFKKDPLTNNTNDNRRVTYDIYVKAGYRYYLYSTAPGGIPWTVPFYGFTFTPATANNRYAVANDEKVYNHKHIYSVDNIVMTYGGWLSEQDARQSDIIKTNDTWDNGRKQGTPFSGFEYTAVKTSETPDPANESNMGYGTGTGFTPNDGQKGYYQIPSRGTFYKFEPKKNGTLVIYVLQTENRTVYFMDENGITQKASTCVNPQGTSLAPDANNGYKATAKSAYKYTFAVYAGKTYFLFAAGSNLGLYGFTFDASNENAAEVTMTYGQNNPQEKSYANVTFNRTLIRNRWNSLVLPFSMTEAQVRETFGEGTLIMQFDDVAKNTIQFKRHYYQHIVSGQPCLIFPTGGYDAVADSSNHETMATSTMKGVSIRYATAGLKEYKSVTQQGYTFKGLYGVNETIPGTSYWVVSGNTIGRRTKPTKVAGNFLAYLQGPATTVGAKPLTLGLSNFTEDKNAGTTGIENIENKQTRMADNKVYNLQGQLVKDNATDLSGLPGGMYIVNGKKFLVK